MIEEDQNYFINNPVFLKYKNRLDLGKFSQVRYLKSVYINERIVEIPFVLASLQGLPPKNRILDLGCMESIFPLQAASLGFQVTGADIRPYPYHHPNFDFVKTDICQLPFKDQEFDAVVSISTIEHIGLGIYDDPQVENGGDRAAVLEAIRVLKNKGIFVLTVPFGKPQINENFRIYDQGGIEKLLDGVKLENMKYFASKRSEHERSNFWQEISCDEASAIESSGSANCVCLIKARK